MTEISAAPETPFNSILKFRGAIVQYVCGLGQSGSQPLLLQYYVLKGFTIHVSSL